MPGRIERPAWPRPEILGPAPLGRVPLNSQVLSRSIRHPALQRHRDAGRRGQVLLRLLQQPAGGTGQPQGLWVVWVGAAVAGPGVRAWKRSSGQRELGRTVLWWQGHPAPRPHNTPVMSSSTHQTPPLSSIPLLAEIHACPEVARDLVPAPQAIQVHRAAWKVGGGLS